MLLHLDPHYRLVWRSPSSLQLGVEQPIVVLNNVTPSQERMIAALISGVTRQGLELVARSSGADVSTAAELLEVMSPALRTEITTTRSPGRVIVAGRGHTAETLFDLLVSAGVTVIWQDDSVDPSPRDIAVLIDHFVIDPTSRGYWLRRDIPHLPIVIGDSTVRIGPVIEPGRGPCLWCIDRELTDQDSAWPAIVSQLWGRRSAADHGIVATETASIAARQILQRRDGPSASPRLTSTSTSIDTETGAISKTQWATHPECGCAVLPETSTADAFPTSEPTPQTTTAPINAELG